MKVLWQGYSATNHSWSVVSQNISRQLIKQGHQVDIFSTNGIQYFPEDLKPYLIGYYDQNKVIGREPHHEYDMCMSYSQMMNWSKYLCHSKKNRFGIWCYEWAGKNIIPTGFAKYYKCVDKILAPSNFAKQVFVDSNIPESAIEVIPHGVSENFILNKDTIELPTKKTYKILANIAQNHKRKNIKGLLDVYGKAFNKNDDVCLILKGKDKKVEHRFEVSLRDLLSDFRKRYPNHAEIILYDKYLTDISSLYRSVDTFITLAHSECFLIPAIESIISGKLVIAPGWGGQIDFLDESNSLLIEGAESRADPTSMYYESKNNAVWFNPSIDDAVNKLRFAKNNYQILNSKIEKNREEFYEKYSWNSVTNRILQLCK